MQKIQNTQEVTSKILSVDNFFKKYPAKQTNKLLTTWFFSYIQNTQDKTDNYLLSQEDFRHDLNELILNLSSIVPSSKEIKQIINPETSKPVLKRADFCTVNEFFEEQEICVKMGECIVFSKQVLKYCKENNLTYGCLFSCKKVVYPRQAITKIVLDHFESFRTN